MTVVGYKTERWFCHSCKQMSDAALEVERLRKERDWAWGKGYESAKVERNAMQAEIERLRGEIESWKALVSEHEAEIERLRAQALKDEHV